MEEASLKLRKPIRQVKALEKEKERERERERERICDFFHNSEGKFPPQNQPTSSFPSPFSFSFHIFSALN